MISTLSDHDQTLGLRPTHLVVPPALRTQALLLVKAATGKNGASNINYDSVEVIVSPWLV